MTFNEDPTIQSNPVFFAGDSAGGQSDDSWTFIDASGSAVTNAITIDSSFWTSFDTIDLEPITKSGNVNNLAAQNMSFLAWNIEQSDFLAGKDWQDVEGLVINIPGVGDEPRTDYSFIGVNNIIVDTPNAIVPTPEPSSVLLGGIGSLLMLIRRSKKIA